VGKTMMNCDEAAELLDAYAVGALEKSESNELMRHVAGCLNCLEELSKSERTAGLLALAVPIQKAPAHLRDRLMAQAGREGGAATHRLPLWQRLRPGWRSTARAVGLAGVVALAFSAFLQVQMSGLRGDKNDLEQQLTATGAELEQQRQIVAVLSAPDTRKVPMEAATIRSQAESVYNWSRQNDTGFIVCHNFPPLPVGSVYQVWFTAEAGSAEPVATFVPQDGGCQIPMDMSRLDWRPAGIGISVEPEGGSVRPSSRWFAYASFEREAQEGSGRSGGGLDMALAAFGP
jgi:anti-sigma-K factor RskA